MKAELKLLDLDRDLPTTAEDVEMLWKLARVLEDDLLVNVNRLLAPNWSLERAAALPLFDGCEPFEL